MGKNSRIFKKEYIADTLGLPYGEAGVTIISDTMDDHSRWSVGHTLIFRIDAEQPEDEAWRVNYQVGATENQDERPWEYDEEVEATLVRRVVKPVEVWETAQ